MLLEGSEERNLKRTIALQLWLRDGEEDETNASGRQGQTGRSAPGCVAATLQGRF